MAEFAVIENDLVVNVIVAETKEIAEEVTARVCVALPPLGPTIGWTFKGGSFLSPEQVQANADK